MVRLLRGIAVVVALSTVEITVADNSSNDTNGTAAGTTSTSAPSSAPREDGCWGSAANFTCTSPFVLPDYADWLDHFPCRITGCSAVDGYPSECCAIKAEVAQKALAGDKSFILETVEGIGNCDELTWKEAESDIVGESRELENIDETSKTVVFKDALASDVAEKQTVYAYPVDCGASSADSGNSSDSGEILDDDAAIDARLSVAFGIGLSFIFLS